MWIDNVELQPSYYVLWFMLCFFGNEKYLYVVLWDFFHEFMAKRRCPKSWGYPKSSNRHGWLRMTMTDSIETTMVTSWESSHDFRNPPFSLGIPKTGPGWSGHSSAEVSISVSSWTSAVHGPVAPFARWSSVVPRVIARGHHGKSWVERN